MTKFGKNMQSRKDANASFTVWKHTGCGVAIAKPIGLRKERAGFPPSFGVNSLREKIIAAIVNTLASVTKTLMENL